MEETAKQLEITLAQMSAVLLKQIITERQDVPIGDLLQFCKRLGNKIRRLMDTVDSN